MTIFSFLVGVGLVWFCCFMYVVQSLYHGERVALTTGHAGGSAAGNAAASERLAGHFARTRIRRGAGPGLPG